MKKEIPSPGPPPPTQKPYRTSLTELKHTGVAITAYYIKGGQKYENNSIKSSVWTLLPYLIHGTNHNSLCIEKHNMKKITKIGCRTCTEPLKVGYIFAKLGLETAPRPRLPKVHFSQLLNGLR
jgi:hypothetical protein